MADNAEARTPGWRDFLPEFITLAALVLTFALNAGVFEIDPYSELFHLEAAKETAHAGGFWIPVLQGHDYLVRAPLWTWLVTLLFKLAGPGLWVARLPAILFALLAVWLTYMTGVVVFRSRTVALFSALVLGSCWGYFTQSVLSTADIAVTSLMLAYTMLVAQWHPAATRRYVVREEVRVYSLAFGVLLGLMLLLKGSMMVAIMALMLVVFLARTGTLKALNTLLWPYVLAGMLIIPLPWLVGVAMAQGNSGLILDYLFIQPFQQWMGRGIWASLQPDWLFYIRRAGVAFLPYLVFLLAFWLDTPMKRKIDAATRPWLLWMVLWFFVGVGFYSLSHFQEPTVMLAFYPALALLAGYYLGRALEMGETTRAYNAATGGYIVVLMLLAVALTVFIFQVLPDDYVLGYWHFPGQALLTALHVGIEIPLEEPIPLWKLWLLPGPVILVAGGTVLYFMFENRRVHMAGFALIMTCIVFLLGVKSLYLPILHRPVPATLAAELERQVPPPREVLIYSRHPDLKRVLFYLNPDLSGRVRFLSSPESLAALLRQPDTGGDVYGVIRENAYYALDPSIRQRLRIQDAGWKVDVVKLGELAKILQARLPLFERMESRIILFQVLPESVQPVRTETEVSP